VSRKNEGVVLGFTGKVIGIKESGGIKANLQLKDIAVVAEKEVLDIGLSLDIGFSDVWKKQGRSVWVTLDFGKVW
jgi:hypothetical protein